MKRIHFIFLILFSNWVARAQTLTDGLMMPQGDLCTGVLFNHEQWKSYWEGSLKRTNDNIGRFSAQSVTWVGNYGITQKINAIAMLPYVSTQATGGTMRGMEGIQDLTLGLKYEFATRKIGSGTARLFGIGMMSTPLSAYTPDYLPFSIGLASTNVGGRVTANYFLEKGFYVNASGGYTWRSNVLLDRPSYFTDGRIVYSNEVWMPNVVDFNVDFGYIRNGLQLTLSYQQQNTLGGGDIRRQDMPFVSNRMNAARVGALVMYYLPFHRNLALRGMVNQTVYGRNVGQTTTLLAGALYTLHFKKKSNQ
jgi:hypothetical protein